MILRVHHDYVEDEYGNYYVVIGTTHGSQDDNEVILRNALVDICFSTVLIDDYYKEREFEYLGTYPMRIIRGIVKSAKEGKRDVRLFSIDEVRKHYKISFELRHPEEKKQL